jgi:hypothetical protein
MRELRFLVEIERKGKGGDREASLSRTLAATEWQMLVERILFRFFVLSLPEVPSEKLCYVHACFERRLMHYQPILTDQRVSRFR